MFLSHVISHIFFFFENFFGVVRYLPYQYEDLLLSELLVYLKEEYFSCSIFLHSVCVPVHILQITSLQNVAWIFLHK